MRGSKSNWTCLISKLGKKCTKVAEDNTYEKSLVWFIDKASLETFDQKINKQNCELNGEKS